MNWGTVYVRWRTPFPGSGYQVWDGGRWLDITMEEYAEYRKRNLAVHTNPAYPPEAYGVS